MKGRGPGCLSASGRVGNGDRFLPDGSVRFLLDFCETCPLRWDTFFYKIIFQCERIDLWFSPTSASLIVFSIVANTFRGSIIF